MLEMINTGKICSTCGSASDPLLILICNLCKDISAHVYCMEVLPPIGGLPEHWTCEDCDKKTLEDLKGKSPLIDTQISVKEKKLVIPSQVGKTKYIPKGEIATPKYNGKRSLDQMKSQKTKLVADILRDATKDKAVRADTDTVQGKKKPIDIKPNPLNEKLNIPIPTALWKGGIEYFEHVIHSHNVEAHLAQNVSEKVGEIFKKMGPIKKLNLKVKSLKEAWPKAFKLCPPCQQDIGFYLFSSETNRLKEKFIRLVERLNNSHQVLTGINGEPYLWGVLLHHKRKKKQTQVKSKIPS